MRKYSLLKYILIAGALLMVLLPAYHLLVISPAFSQLIIRQLEENTKLFSTHLVGYLHSHDQSELTPASITEEFIEQAHNFQSIFQLRKIKFFNASGTVIFATDPADMGKNHPVPDIFPRLLAGKSVSKLITGGGKTLEGEEPPADVIELYTPIINAEGRYLGAFETYYEFRGKDQQLSWMTSQLGGVLGFAAMLMIISAIYLSLKQNSLLQERAIATAQLEEARDLWEQTFNAIEDVITVMDDEFRIVKVNLATTKFFGTTAEALIGRYCHEIFRGEPTPCSSCPGLLDLRTGVAHTSEIYHPQLDKHLLVSICRIHDHTGRQTGLVHVARDISEQKNLENHLRQTQKLEAIGVLTSGVAHNFRNILASIKTSTQLIQMEYSGDDKLQEITRWIIDSVDYGSGLVNGLNKFSSLKRSREFKPVDLNKITADAFRILRGSMTSKTELYLVQYPERIPVLGDAGDLMQVIINICNNAKDAINGIGIIRIQLQRSEKTAIIKISDNGPGIAPEIIEKIFEPFFTTKDVDKGTGLGLSTSFGIVREHDGEIRADSKIGLGTTFTITLPIALGERQLEKPAAQTPAGAAQKILMDSEAAVGDHPTPAAAPYRILVVDDEPLQVELNRRTLTKIGYKVTGAGGCAEAMQSLNDWHPDLVLMDVNMPGCDGFACADAFYEIDPSVRVIMISGNEIKVEDNLDGPRSRYIRALLTKPVNLADLTAVISRVLATPTPPKNLNPTDDAVVPPPA